MRRSAKKGSKWPQTQKLTPKTHLPPISTKIKGGHTLELLSYDHSKTSWLFELIFWIFTMQARSIAFWKCHKSFYVLSLITIWSFHWCKEFQFLGSLPATMPNYGKNQLLSDRKIKIFKFPKFFSMNSWVYIQFGCPKKISSFGQPILEL